MGKHCFPNLIVGIDHIKPAHQFQIIHRKTFAKLGGQIRRKFLQNLFTIGGTIFSVLFFLYNHSANLKVGIDHGEIYRRFGIPSVHLFIQMLFSANFHL